MKAGKKLWTKIIILLIAAVLAGTVVWYAGSSRSPANPDKDASGESLAESTSETVTPTGDVDETDPDESFPEETEPEGNEPTEAEPEETDPVASDPVETEPVETEPVDTKPNKTEETKGTEPDSTEPVTEPEESENTEPESDRTEATTEPEETEETEPEETEPEETEHVHTLVEVPGVPTCEEDGYTTLNCECGYSQAIDVVKKLGHDWSDWVITVEPTTTSVGERERTCSRCGTVTETVPMLDAETGEAYESYIDPRIVITHHRNNTGYDFADIAVTDFRDWGDLPSIWINDDGSWTVVYFQQDGTRVELVLDTPPEGYIQSCKIRKDGSYLISLIGNYGD